jgi:hypothetical protein
VTKLQTEISSAGFAIPGGQLLFCGKAYAQPPVGHFKVDTFLSTTLCPSVAAVHARDHAAHQHAKGCIWIIETARPVTALFVPAGKPLEYEVLMSPDQVLVVCKTETSGPFDIVTATLL